MKRPRRSLAFRLMNRFIHLKLWQYKPRIKAGYITRHRPSFLAIILQRGKRLFDRFALCEKGEYFVACSHPLLIPLSSLYSCHHFFRMNLKGHTWCKDMNVHAHILNNTTLAVNLVNHGVSLLRIVLQNELVCKIAFVPMSSALWTFGKKWVGVSTSNIFIIFTFCGLNSWDSGTFINMYGTTLSGHHQKMYTFLTFSLHVRLVFVQVIPFD